MYNFCLKYISFFTHIFFSCAFSNDRSNFFEIKESSSVARKRSKEYLKETLVVQRRF